MGGWNFGKLLFLTRAEAEARLRRKENGMAEYTDKAILKSLMRKYGFRAPDMTIKEFVDDECPTADAAPVVHGYWIEVNRIEHDCETEIEEKCSVCGRHVCRYDTQPQDNHCPKCGACMIGGKSNG